MNGGSTNIGVYKLNINVHKKQYVAISHHNQLITNCQLFQSDKLESMPSLKSQIERTSKSCFRKYTHIAVKLHSLALNNNITNQFVAAVTVDYSTLCPL
jgi:hypothetical protein